MDDVVTLLGDETIEYDDEGNQIIEREERNVFCSAESIGRSEFYAAASAGLKPEWTLTLANSIDYHGETLARFHDDLFSIIRTYQNGDGVELTLERKVGNDEDL